MIYLRRILFTLACALGIVGSAYGQISVDLQIKRRTFMRYEPIPATVNVTNLSGGELLLEDADVQWFGFQINMGSNEAVVPPRNPDYHLDPLVLKPGETVKRTVNLNSLYSLGEFGRYRIRATIYSKSLGKFFASKPDAVEVSEGHLIWQQSVGVPEGMANAGHTHSVSLLATQDSDSQKVYIRVEDRALGTVFCTYPLGPKMEGMEPQIQFDSANNIYVLLGVGQKNYTLSKLTVNGELVNQTNYTSVRARPYLRRSPDGKLQIVGGQREVPPDPNVPVPKLSDRPPGLPPK